MEEQEIEIHYDVQNDQYDGQQENGVEIPFNRINDDTLRNLISEFVTREWNESGGGHFSLEDKVNQVLHQLEERKARVVFDLTAQTANIVVSR
jgi:uncharacterized protein YheU (UPF0270 family)